MSPQPSHRLTPKRREAFLAALARGSSIVKSAEIAGLTRECFYLHRKNEPDFAAAWDDAIEAGTDLLEDEAVRRAYEGVDKPVYQGGELVGYVREYSDTLLIFTLKARRPHKFRDRISTEITGANGGPIETSNIDDIRLAQDIVALLERAAGAKESA